MQIRTHNGGRESCQFDDKLLLAEDGASRPHGHASVGGQTQGGLGGQLCIYYKNVNGVTEIRAYPISHMELTLRKLVRAKYISTIDFSSAYHQVRVKKKCRKYMAFTMPN